MKEPYIVVCFIDTDEIKDTVDEIKQHPSLRQHTEEIMLQWQEVVG